MFFYNQVVLCNFQGYRFINITFESSGVKLRSSFMSGGGAQRRNVLERFVI